MKTAVPGRWLLGFKRGDAWNDTTIDMCIESEPEHPLVKGPAYERVQVSGFSQC